MTRGTQCLLPATCQLVTLHTLHACHWSGWNNVWRSCDIFCICWSQKGGGREGYSTHLYNFPPDLSQVSSWWVLGGWDNPWPKVPHAHNPCITTQAGLKAAATKDASRVGALSSTLCDFGMIIYCFKVSNFQRTLYFWAVEKGSENNLAYYMFQDKKYIYVYRSLL